MHFDFFRLCCIDRIRSQSNMNSFFWAFDGCYLIHKFHDLSSVLQVFLSGLLIALTQQVGIYMNM